MNKSNTILKIALFSLFGLLLFFKNANSIPADLNLIPLAKAKPDECFCGVGDSNNNTFISFTEANPTGFCGGFTPAGDGPTDLGNACCENSLCGPDPSCTLASTCIPKMSESYPWGLSKAGPLVWIGTLSNLSCFGNLQFFATTFGSTPMISSISFTSNTPPFYPTSVCEFSESVFPNPPTVPENFGDQRPPGIYTYNTQTTAYEKKSVDGCPSFTSGFSAEDLLDETTGFRSSGSTKVGSEYIIFMAGPAPGGLNFFAFRQSSNGTSTCIGAKKLTSYNDVRKWVDAGGYRGLYVGVGVTDGGGRVLRWKGTFTNPFVFAEVGRIDAPVSNIAVHFEGSLLYLAVTTWPNINNLSETSQQLDLQSLLTLIRTLVGTPGVWISPPMKSTGLTTSDFTNWKKVFSFTRYEPDTTTGLSYGGGDLASFGGYLYFGTMHVPGIHFIAHASVYESDILDCSTASDPAECQDRATEAFLNTDRGTAIFRGKKLATTTPIVELLYGEEKLPMYMPNTGSWTTVNNKLNQTSKFGPSGFGINVDIGGGNTIRAIKYSWTAAVFRDKLLVPKLYWGTFTIEGINGKLFRFPNTTSPAEIVFDDGAGNRFNYGVRTILADDCLFLGMANPYSLLDLPLNLPSPFNFLFGGAKGGWELKKLCNK